MELESLLYVSLIIVQALIPSFFSNLDVILGSVGDNVLILLISKFISLRIDTQLIKLLADISSLCGISKLICFDLFSIEISWPFSVKTL